MKSLTLFRKFDWILAAAACALMAFGLAVLYSTSLGGDAATADYSTFIKQCLYAAVGLATLFLVSMSNYRTSFKLAKLGYLLSVISLVLVLLLGVKVRGATGWFRIGSLSLQPVEFVKIAFIVYLARFFAMHSRDGNPAARILGSLVSAGVMFVLIAAQPSLGSACLLLFIWAAMLLVSGVKRWHIGVAVLLSIAVALITWAFILKPYQRDRIAVFWNPTSQTQGRAYNITQSIIAVGSGGLTGKGLGYGSQSQLRFLPERQTDFIFAVISEELGFLGALLVCGLYGTIFYRSYQIALRAKDDFTMFIIIGITVSIAVEAFVNIGANLRMVPVTGVTLPFISFGGSSLIAKCFMIGLLESIAMRE